MWIWFFCFSSIRVALLFCACEDSTFQWKRLSRTEAERGGEALLNRNCFSSEIGPRWKKLGMQGGGRSEGCAWAEGPCPRRMCLDFSRNYHYPPPKTHSVFSPPSSLLFPSLPFPFLPYQLGAGATAKSTLSYPPQHQGSDQKSDSSRQEKSCPRFSMPA